MESLLGNFELGAVLDRPKAAYDLDREVAEVHNLILGSIGSIELASRTLKRKAPKFMIQMIFGVSEHGAEQF